MNIIFTMNESDLCNYEWWKEKKLLKTWIKNIEIIKLGKKELYNGTKKELIP